MPRGRKPREYPPEIVDMACSMYQSGMTIAEIRAVFPKGYKVQLILKRYLGTLRSTAKRDQRGERNHMWKGNQANYQAMHLRVQSARGRPSHCEQCGTTDTSLRYEWANATGNYADVNDYIRMCVSCHRRYDAARRRATGQRTSPVRGGGANV